MTDYTPGSTHGAWTVIKETNRRTRGGSHRIYRARSICCGNTRDVSANTLRQSRLNKATKCFTCRNKLTRHEGRLCPQCGALPWRRPEDGSLCACGERFELEAIPRPEVMHSSGAVENFGVVAVDWR